MCQEYHKGQPCVYKPILCQEGYCSECDIYYQSLQPIRIGNRLRFDKPVHILVVDDEPVIGQLFKASLNEHIYQVTTTLSSLEALELVGNRHFALIFIDLLMPELDGAELFRRIRQMDKNIPVAIITGYPDSDLMRRAMKCGPFTVMQKPFSSDDILNIARSFV